MYDCVQNIDVYEFEIIQVVRKFHSLIELMLYYVIDVVICEQFHSLEVISGLVSFPRSTV
jgi:hypothetical protein